MAATSDERREVAARLRENANKHGVVLDYMGSRQAASWWLLLHTIGCDSNEQEVAFRMLADLIDPTCKVSSVETYDDELGRLEGWEFHMTCGHSFQQPWNEPPAYCPDCGARVVNGNTDNSKDSRR